MQCPCPRPGGVGGHGCGALGRHSAMVASGHDLHRGAWAASARWGVGTGCNSSSGRSAVWR